MKIQRALISVSDKSGISQFARALHAAGIELISTGGTAKHLLQADVPIRRVADYTGFPEIMAGRVKTLHPKVHGALLARRGIDDGVMRAQGIAPIDLLVVNLYPFEAVVEEPDCTFHNAIENIDIGGPAMLRAAAKNHAAVTVVVDPGDYPRILAEMRAHDGAVSAPTRYALAGKGFAHTARYDAAIANYFGRRTARGERRRFPPFYTLQVKKQLDMRYGENPHQAAALYGEYRYPGPTIAASEQLQGKALSFNNVADADAALACVRSYEAPACVIVKHANPCGVATDTTLLKAYERAYATDPVSAFGGIIALNRRLTAAAAQAMIERQFVEVLLAPDIAPDARDVLGAKRNIRVLTWDGPSAPDKALEEVGLDYKRVAGGLLVQSIDHRAIKREDLTSVTRCKPDAATINDLLFAWRVVKYVKSNAIVYVRDTQTLGIGAGQMSRIDSARIAAMKAAEAGLAIRGAVMASDAFFPFRDSVDLAAEAGIAAIIQPGGSRRDQEVIAAAEEHNIAMVFTGVRHFRH